MPNGIKQESLHGEIPEEQRFQKVIVSGSLAQGIAGGGAIALTIIGLAGILPQLMLSVATIAIGAALVLEGGSVASRFSDLLSEASRGRLDAAELGMGMTAELFGGIAGASLGVLSLLNIYPTILIASAAIVFGSTQILGSGITARLNSLEIVTSGEHKIFKEVAREAVSAAAGVQLLIGLGVVTLGILALVGMSPLELSLVAMLSIGFSGLLSGTAIAARLLNIFRQK